jgi:hypothetical protein
MANLPHYRQKLDEKYNHLSINVNFNTTGAHWQVTIRCDAPI